MSEEQRLIAIASRVALSAVNGAAAYVPADDEIVSTNDAQLIVEYVNENLERRKITNITVTFDSERGTYLIGRKQSVGASSLNDLRRPQQGHAATQNLMRRRR